MKNIWVWVVVAIIVIGGGFWYWQSMQAPAMSDDGTPAAVDAVDDANAAGAGNQTSDTSGTGVQVGVTAGTAPMSATVTYNGSSFSPSSVTIARGGTVTFTSTGPTMWVASAPHPTHEGYDGTTRSQHCAAGYSGAAP